MNVRSISGCRGQRSQAQQGCIDAWQRTVLAICVMASIAAGIGAYAYLSAMHAPPNRLSWSLEPPHRRAPATHFGAPTNLQAAQAFQRRPAREM